MVIALLYKVHVQRRKHKYTWSSAYRYLCRHSLVSGLGTFLLFIGTLPNQHMPVLESSHNLHLRMRCRVAREKMIVIEGSPQP